jgi:tetratricopeptide (TPR) repeat protein/DNA-binding CsgD family transcriptional regulator
VRTISNFQGNKHIHIRGVSFTPREIDILSCIVSGWTSRKSMAIKLRISTATVASHMKDLMRKLECSSWEHIRNAINNEGVEEELRAHFRCLETDQSYQINYPKINEHIADHRDVERSKSRLISLEVFQKNNLGRLFFKKQNIIFLGSIIAICLFVLFDIVYSSHFLKSELPLPLKNNLLSRSELCSQISNRLKVKTKPDNIHSVLIVGAGGAGKTTLARMIARRHKGIVWEINADSELSVIQSLKSFAQAIAVHENLEEIKWTRLIHEAHDAEQLIYLIREKLKQHPNWLLIFDNVESLSKISAFIPQNPEIWGRGSIIITTRNVNVSVGFSQEDIFAVGELSQTEKESLFLSINPNFFSQNNKKIIKEVLKKIPAFPLDVTIAAIYLRNSSIDHSHYIDNIDKKGHDILHKELLHEYALYQKNRYNIIATSARAVLDQNKNFYKLLLICCLLDSQNIPEKLLELHTDKITAALFMNALRKYSLITSEQKLVQNMASFSLHRVTQNIILLTLLDIVTKEQYLLELSNVVYTYEKYVTFEIDSYRYPTLQGLLIHAEQLSNKLEKYPRSLYDILISIKTNLMTLLGFNDMKILQEMSSCLDNLRKNYADNKLRIANVLSNLSITEGMLGNLEGALQHSEECCKLFQDLRPFSINSAMSYKRLSQLYRLKGLYNKSFNTALKSYHIFNKLSNPNLGFAEFLEVVSMIFGDVGKYKKALSYQIESLRIKREFKLPKSLIAVSLACLSITYLDLGHFSEARSIIEEIFPIFKTTYGANSIYLDWLYSFLGAAYFGLKDYNKSTEILEKLFQKYRDNLDNSNYIFFKVALPILGKNYIVKRQYDKATVVFEKSLNLLEKHYGIGHVKTAIAITNLGVLRLKENKFDSAEVLFEKAMAIYQKYPHTDSFITLQGLGELYLQKGNQLLKTAPLLSSEYLSKSKAYFLKAWNNIQKNFPSDSIIRQEFQARMKSINHFNPMRDKLK